MGAPKGHPCYNPAGRPREYTREVLDKLADDLLEYANDPTALTLRGWAARKNRGEDWMNDLVSTEEKLVEKEGGERNFFRAQNAALNIIGERRENMALTGQFAGDTSIVKASLATYDMRHRAMLKEMKQAEAPKPTQVIIERSRLDDDRNKS
jgi:hypothetical protein